MVETRAEMPGMKGQGQTRQEAQIPKRSPAAPHKLLKVGTWNVRTLFEAGKMEQTTREMDRYNINILGLSEVRWVDSGKQNLSNGGILCYSGRVDGQHTEGVGLMMDKATKNSLLEWEPISPRLIRARFNSKLANVTVLQCYAPTDQAGKEKKEEFYQILQDQISNVPRHDILIVMGDMNAKVGTNNEGFESCMGQQGMGERSENGEYFLNLCRENDLVIGGTIFQHKDIHKATWKSPNNRTRNQIDHIAINGRWRTSLHDVRAARGAVVGSDHYLIISKIRVKVRRAQKRQMQKHLNSQRLSEWAVRENFAIELSNRFHILSEMSSEDVEGMNEEVNKAFIETGTAILGHKTQNRKRWIGDDSWNLIEKRKQLHLQLLNSKKGEAKLLQKQYQELDKIIKKSIREDKRKYLDRQIEEAQEAADKGEIGAVYKITRNITGLNFSSTAVVKDRNGRTLAKTSDQLQRWADHFQNILNREEPQETWPASRGHRHQLQIKKGDITCQEIEEAIRQSKNNKAPGEDQITAEMLKADIQMSAKCLVALFNKVWKDEKVPEMWRRGIIVKIPKKGDLTNCDNWRGINLLSVPGKVFCRILLGRIKDSVDKLLREEQAGFRKDRSCIDQIFVLRTIVEQSLEWNSSLYINFIDFEKAFDSVHHPSLWNILTEYGFPDKIINILKDIYTDNQCCVRHQGQQSSWFHVRSGVRQGCILSPLLFLVTMDWVMRRANELGNRGIVWDLSTRLEDLDFADDIALLAHTKDDIQVKTENLSRVAKTVGLKINANKSKIMRFKARNQGQIKIDEVEMEEVDDFRYLGSYISKDGTIEKEISTRIGSAAAAFKALDKVWRSTAYKTCTKVNIYKSNVRSVLLYGSETWKTNAKCESRLRGFEGRCLRRILKIRWEQRVTNMEIAQKTGINNINEEVRKRRWKWLGHVLRMQKKRHPYAALKWNPSGQRSVGKPRETWRRTIEKEMAEMGKTWNELRWLAQDRSEWRKIVCAYAPHGS